MIAGLQRTRRAEAVGQADARGEVGGGDWSVRARLVLTSLAAQGLLRGLDTALSGPWRKRLNNGGRMGPLEWARTTALNNKTSAGTSST